MGLQKITFDGASINAKIDAELYHFLFSRQVGIIKGYKNGLSFTVSSNTITFKDGYVSVYGRLVYVENNTQIKVTLDSSKKGFVVLGINTSTNAVTLYLKEQSGSYPTLTQTDLISNDGLYELVLCAYTKTPTSITVDNSYEKQYIENVLSVIQEVKQEIRADGEVREVTPTTVGTGIYSISDVNSYILSRSLISVVISSTVVTFPGAILFLSIGSNASVSYRFAGADYILALNYEAGVLTFSVSGSQKINKVYLYKR